MKLLLKNQAKGFSLIEVLVSLSIFTIVVTICVSTLYSLIEANSRSRNSQSIATNLSFTLDSMAREIRTGSSYYCSASSNDLPVGKDDNRTSNCNGGSAFSFNEGGQSLTHDATPAETRRIGYRLSNDGKIQRRLGNGDDSGSADDPSDWEDLTSDDVNITDFNFYVQGSSRDDLLSPIVTLFVKGEVGDEDIEREEFVIQTTIAQRLLDI